MRQGYTLVVSGWQADLPKDEGDFTAHFPVAKRGGGPLGKTITVELLVTKPAFTLSIGWDNGRALQPYPPFERQLDRARLIRRAHADAPDEVIPRDEWSFGSCPDGKTNDAEQRRRVPAGRVFARCRVLPLVSRD